MPTPPKRASGNPDRPNALVNRLEPGQTDAEGNASLVVAGLASNSVAQCEWSTYPFGDRVDITACLNAVVDAAERVNRGNLGDLEAVLTAQAITLNAVFTQLSHRAQLNMGEHLDATDRYLRLALKAQGQCRATVETLATLKNPTVFARQANIAHGPQQVNNVVAQPDRGPSRARGRSRTRAKQTIGASDVCGTDGQWNGGRDKRARSGAGGRGNGQPARGRRPGRRDRPGTRTAAACGGRNARELSG